jgi:hypothetical protein
MGTRATGGTVHLLPVLLSSAISVAGAQPRIVLGGDPAASTPHVFTRVASVAELRDGGLLVVDRGERALYYTTLDGSEPRAVARTGGGPGEFHTPGRLVAFGPDSFLVTDEFTQRWSVLSGTRFVRSLAESRALNREMGADVRGLTRSGLVLGARTRRAGARESADSLELIVADLDAGEPTVIGMLAGRGASLHISSPRGNGPQRLMIGSPLAAEDRAVMFSDGWIAVARKAPYRVDWRDPTGTWTRGPSLQRTTIPVNAEVQCASLRRMMGPAVPCDPTLVRDWPEVVPPFLPPSLRHPQETVHATPDGNVLVWRAPIGLAGGNLYELLGRDGTLRATLELPEHITIVGFGASAVYTFAVDADGLQSIRRHRWRESGSAH